jgi:cysteine sulfinate desulfinase/cysteine desulfurase-like protein
MTAVYLDFNATAPVRPEAKAALNAVLDRVGNPSSVHAAGRAARADLEKAREAVAALVGVVPGSVTFTSGGTEASALAIESAVAAKVERILLGATEHDAVWEAAHVAGLPVEIWPVDAHGVADLAWLDSALARPGRALVCLMLANNETGVIQPVAQAGEKVRGRQDRHRFQHPAGRYPQPVRPQDRRPAGRRRPGGRNPRNACPSPARRWSGTRPPRRHRKSARHRRLRRRRP